jgi:hypothetical protein
MRPLHLALLSVLAIAPVARAEDASKGAHPSKPAATFITADQIQWGEAPPVLPRGAQIAVLHGDPFKKGPYTLRLKMPNAYRIPPHWHTQDEQLTVLSGTFLLYMGDTTGTTPHTLATDAYHFLPGRMHHAAEVVGETVVQVQGMGPFDIHYLNPADNPMKTVSAATK